MCREATTRSLYKNERLLRHSNYWVPPGCLLFLLQGMNRTVRLVLNVTYSHPQENLMCKYTREHCTTSAR